MLGYDIKHVMNITDVGHLTGDNDEGEDKMKKSAAERHQSVLEVAQYYTNAFMKDMDGSSYVWSGETRESCPAWMPSISVTRMLSVRPLSI